MAKPNVVFLHGDQMHHKAVSAYGCKQVHTPNLDRIVGEGYSFMESYSAMPQCCPARASWYTGRMSKEHGVVVNSYPIDPTVPDLGQWLRRSGYETVYTGKWHVSGRDVRKSFDVLHTGSGHGELGDSAVARSAVAYLKNRVGDRPFFLSVGLLNPHDCCFPARNHGGPGKFAYAPKIRGKLPPLPENFDYEYATQGMNQIQRWSLEDWRYYIYSYYRMVEMMDHEVGRVYNALRSSPYADNTIFIFSSDHGDGAGFHAKVSKGYLEEEAARVPAIVSWPGRIEGGVRDTRHLVSGVDVAATICDYAGAPPLPKTTIARSWRPLLEGKETTWRDYVVSETSIGPLSTAIRDIRFKSIIYRDRTRLFDIQNDPLETKDLADDLKFADVKRRHREQFREYIGKIELCPGPSGVEQITAQKPAGRAKRKKAPLKRGNLYKAYMEWYQSVKEEG